MIIPSMSPSHRTIVTPGRRRRMACRSTERQVLLLHGLITKQTAWTTTTEEDVLIAYSTQTSHLCAIVAAMIWRYCSAPQRSTIRQTDLHSTLI